MVLSLVAALLWLGSPAVAQIEAHVTMNVDQLPSSARDPLQNFAADVERYINSNKWTSEDIGNEKIQVSITIAFTSYTSPNTYDAQFFLGSSRPVFKSQKSTAMLRLFDDSWEFQYTKSQAFYRDETRFDPLMSFINFYMYLVLGYDFDSYSPPLSGTPFFQKAIAICAQAPSGTKGWDRNTSSAYSKYSFIEELLNTRYEPIREGMYMYNYKGIDYLTVKPELGYKNIIKFIQDVADFKRSVDPRSTVVKIFFDAKYQELADIFRNYQDPSILQLLSNVDPSHESIYMNRR